MFTFDYCRSNYPISKLAELPLESIVQDQALARERFFESGALLVRPNETTGNHDEIVKSMSEVGKPFAEKLFGMLTEGQVMQIQERVLPDTVHRPHAEASFSPVRPAVLVFACTSQDDEDDIGGLTTLLNGSNIWKQLSPSSKSCLLTANVEYKLRIQVKPKRTASDVRREWFLPEIGVADTCLDIKNGHLYFTYSHPFLHYHPISREIIIANHAFIDTSTEEQILSRKVTFGKPLERAMEDLLVEDLNNTLDDNIHTMSWKVGDILILDNMRFMHGRLPSVSKLKRILKVVQYKSYLI